MSITHFRIALMTAQGKIYNCILPIRLEGYTNDPLGTGPQNHGCFTARRVRNGTTSLPGATSTLPVPRDRDWQVSPPSLTRSRLPVTMGPRFTVALARAAAVHHGHNCIIMMMQPPRPLQVALGVQHHHGHDDHWHGILSSA